jgi:hypothetical protein
MVTGAASQLTSLFFELASTKKMMSTLKASKVIIKIIN